MYTTIKADPGWYIIYPYIDITIDGPDPSNVHLKFEPIIAWRIEDSQVIPITLKGGHPDSYIYRPDGVIEQREDGAWSNRESFCSYLIEVNR